MWGLNSSQPYSPPWPLTGIALMSHTVIWFWTRCSAVRRRRCHHPLHRSCTRSVDRSGCIHIDIVKALPVMSQLSIRLWDRPPPQKLLVPTPLSLLHCPIYGPSEMLFSQISLAQGCPDYSRLLHAATTLFQRKQIVTECLQFLSSSFLSNELWPVHLLLPNLASRWSFCPNNSMCISVETNSSTNIYTETSIRNKCRCSFYSALLTLHVSAPIGGHLQVAL
jgi:hypothetical protein